MERAVKFKPHSTPATLMWLQSNYQTVEGVCIPRNFMYTQYVEFCKSNGMMPVNAASFGKIIRQQFSGLTTRRLGTRGQSKYHYYGLTAKSDTNYTMSTVQSSFVRYGIKNLRHGKLTKVHKKEIINAVSEAESSMHLNRGYVQNSVFNFHSTKELLKDLPKNISRNDAETIQIMYTLHCQQLIEFSIAFQFQEVKDYISHFWESFPSHLALLLSHNSIVSIIGVCDLMTYRTITHITMSHFTLAEVPETRIENAIHLAENIIEWLVEALGNAPVVLQRMKLHAARTFLQSVRRSSTLNQVCSTLRFALASEMHLKQMTTDWENLDVQAVGEEMNLSVNYASEIVISYCKELEKLLKAQPTLESLQNWMKILVEKCITSRITDRNYESDKGLKGFACYFLLVWSSVGSRILRELTLQGARSFGMFHLLYLMLTEYGSQLVESLINEDWIQRLTTNIAVGNSTEQNNEFQAGVICNDHCPCKQAQSTINYETCSLSAMTSHTARDEGIYCQEFSQDNQSGDFLLEDSGSYCASSQHSHECVVSRPSCSFQDVPCCCESYDKTFEGPSSSTNLNLVANNNNALFKTDDLNQVLESSEQDEKYERFPATSILSSDLAEFLITTSTSVPSNNTTTTLSTTTSSASHYYHNQYKSHYNRRIAQTVTTPSSSCLSSHFYPTSNTDMMNDDLMFPSSSSSCQLYSQQVSSTSSALFH